LENPIYKGYVRHKNVEYKGLHKAIINEDIFENIQKIFSKSASNELYKPSNSLLKDIIKCGCCDCTMTPTFCNKKGRKYRYYACSNHLRKKSCLSENKNMPAGEVEEFVSKAVRKLLKNPAITALTLHKLDASGIALDFAQNVPKNIEKLWDTLHFNERQRIIRLLIKNVIIDNNGVKILLNPEGTHELIMEVMS
jgi:hypothetical protein